MREKLWKWPLRFAGLLMFCMIACGIICTAEAEAACSHTYQWKVTDTPTCTAGGKEKKICTKCGQVYEVHNLPIDKNNHSYTSSVTKKATCSSTGVRTYKCSRCSKTYTETIAKTSHSYSWVTDVQATCGKAGHENKKCKNCGYIADGRSIPYTNNHTWKLMSTVNATCTKDGSKTYKCSVCGQTKTEKYGTALGHSCSWTTEKKATCYAAGTEAFKCTRSGCSYVERRRDIPYTSHSWSLTSTVEPTCTSAGSKKYKCSNSGCTATKTESYGSATGHSYTWITDVQPSCNRTGHEKKYCTKCGYVADGNTLPYGSHRWVLSYTTGATCTKNGSRTYKCSVCGSTKTEEDKNDPATGHNYEWRVDTYPTCNKGGHDSKACTNCGNVIDGRDTPSNHTWEYAETVEPTCTADGYKLYKCSVCGQTRKDKYKDAIGHNYNIEKATCTENKTCRNCGFVAEYAGHELYHEHVAPTCRENGHDVEKCRNCDFEQGGTTIEKLPHTPDRTNACEEEIKCITCGEVLQEKGHILETKGYYPVCANWHKETYCIACQKTIGVETIQNPDIQPHVLEEEILEQNADCNFKVRKYCTNKDCDYEVIVYEKRHDYYEPNLDDLSSWREDPYMTKYGFELPSCVGPGHYYQVCKNCGDVNPEAVSIPPTGHVRALYPATYTEYGYYFGPCLKCGYDKLPEKEIEYSAEPLGHDFYYECTNGNHVWEEEKIDGYGSNEGGYSVTLTCKLCKAQRVNICDEKGLIISTYQHEHNYCLAELVYSCVGAFNKPSFEDMWNLKWQSGCIDEYKAKLNDRFCGKGETIDMFSNITNVFASKYDFYIFDSDIPLLAPIMYNIDSVNSADIYYTMRTDAIEFKFEKNKKIIFTNAYFEDKYRPFFKNSDKWPTCNKEGEYTLYCQCGESHTFHSEPLGHGFHKYITGHIENSNMDVDICSGCGFRCNYRKCEYESKYYETFSYNENHELVCNVMRRNICVNCGCEERIFGPMGFDSQDQSEPSHLDKALEYSNNIIHLDDLKDIIEEPGLIIEVATDIAGDRLKKWNTLFELKKYKIGGILFLIDNAPDAVKIIYELYLMAKENKFDDVYDFLDEYVFIEEENKYTNMMYLIDNKENDKINYINCAINGAKNIDEFRKYIYHDKQTIIITKLAK